MLASCVALGVTTVAVILYDMTTFRDHALRDAKAQAEMIRGNAQATLLFNDPKTANEIVNALSEKDEISSACLYKANGAVFASYVRLGANSSFPAAEADGHRFENRHLTLFQSIKDSDEFLGTIYLHYEGQPAYTRWPQYVVIVGMVVLALLAVYLFLSLALHRLISTPILNLANTAQIVTDEKNYSVRAPKHADDEIGQLTDAFNHMLATIAARDEAVQSANQELKQGGQELQRELAERQRTQEALHRSEEQWRSLVENAPDIIMTLNQEGTILYINRVLPGFQIEKVIGSRVYDYMPPESQKKLRESLERVFATGQNASSEIVSAGAYNELVWYSSRMGPITSHGKVVAVTLIGSDITERKRAENALRESEERYRRFFEEDLSGDYTAAPSGQLLTCNPAFASIFGFSSVREALRSNLASLHASAEVYDTFMERLRKEKKLIYHEMQLRRLDDKPVFVIQNVLGTFDGNGGLVEFKGYVFDITQHKQLEEQFRQASKMEAVGRLAGGIAHDFNNLLLAILGFSDLLLNDLDPDSPHRDDVTEIQKAAQRAAALTRQLLAYSRKQVLQAKVIDMNQVVSEVNKMLRRMIGEDIELVTILDPDLGKVKADPSQIEQVIINVAINARDAMPQGGRLALRTSNVELDETTSNLQQGSYILLSISDTGSGMSADVKTHLFEPFFTTKDLGQGTGLGLSTVYGIVKQSGGDIEVDSEPGRGTTFKIYFPRMAETALPPKLLDSAAPKICGLETILLAEDEAGVRSLLRRVLEQNGYTVLEAENGTEALQLCAKHPEPIHLLVTDLVMPKMNGRELAERMAQIRPNLQVLYMSGYTDDAIIRQGIQELGTAFLQKPFNPAAFLEKVRQRLDKVSKR
jgi:PAS domain S-box-containing protein